MGPVLYKEWKEHGLVVLMLFAATAVVTALYLADNAASPNAISTFEIVRTTMLSLLPLLAIVLGNRFIVREYQSGAWPFIEALPLRRFTQLSLKYLLGLSLLILFATLVLALAAGMASVADDPSPEYLRLLWLKSATIVFLYWSIAFSFSFSGHLRVVLYGIVVLFLLLIVQHPAIDASRFAPVALMDRDLFVFERDTFPLADVCWTLALGAALSLLGFMVARFAEGAVAARLSRPINRRDMVVIGVMVFAGFGLWSSLVEEDEVGNVAFGQMGVARVPEPAVSVLYLDADRQADGEALAARINTTAAALQAALGLGELPLIQLSWDDEREFGDIDYFTARSLLVRGKWFDIDSYEQAVMDAVVMHGLLSMSTSARATYEPYHWLLDGFTRWWTEGGWQGEPSRHRVELLARANWILDSERRDGRTDTVQLQREFQRLAERHLYSGAESLAFSAMLFIEETRGRDAVLEVAREFLVESHGNNAMADWLDRQSDYSGRFASIVGMSLDDFMAAWNDWLFVQAEDPAVAAKLAAIPAIAADLPWPPVGREPVVHYRALDDFSDSEVLAQLERAAAECDIVHEYLGPFDREVDDIGATREPHDCVPGGSQSSAVYSAPGIRLYIASDLHIEAFHQPLRLGAWRVTVP